MVVMLGLAAAVLYGTGDFLGGLAARRAQVLVVLMLAETASVIVALPAAAMSPGPARLAGLAWGIGAGLVGGLGLIIFYIGLAAGPMSVVAPVSGLVSTVLPVAVALAGGERPRIRRLRRRAALPGRDRAGQLGHRQQPSRRHQRGGPAWG
jgi:drug/metabolite transporter (DMT)-like permease